MEQINVNLIPGGIPQICHASQYDDGRVIRLNLFDGNTPYVLAGTETVTVKVRRSDLTTYEKELDISANSYVDLITTLDMCRASGLSDCELVIESSGIKIGSANFKMAVEADAYGDLDENTKSGGVVEFETVIDEKIKKLQVDFVFDNSSSRLPSSPVDLVSASSCKINYLNWNQMLSVNNQYTRAITVSAVRFALVSNRFSYDLTGSYSGATGDVTNFFVPKEGDTLTKGHIYLVTNNDPHICVRVDGIGSPAAVVTGNRVNVSDQKGIIVKCTTAGDFSIAANFGTNVPLYYRYEHSVLSVNMFDLTAMFSDTIANHLYNLEQSTPGAGVKIFKTLFPEAWYDYNDSNTEKSLASATGDDYPYATFSFGQDVYGGSLILENDTAKLKITHIKMSFNVSDMNNTNSQPGWKDCGVKNYFGVGKLKSETRTNVDNAGIDTRNGKDVIYLRGDGAFINQTTYKSTYPNLVVQVLVPLETPTYIDLQNVPTSFKTRKGENIFFSKQGTTEVTYFNIK